MAYYLLTGCKVLCAELAGVGIVTAVLYFYWTVLSKKMK